MTECQGCGAWNERRRVLCVLCGASLAEVDEWDADAEPLPLPPLPDGGLRASMPAWLRDQPEVGAPETAPVPETAIFYETVLTHEEVPNPGNALSHEVVPNPGNALSHEVALTPSPSPDARERGAVQAALLANAELGAPQQDEGESPSPAHRERGWGEGSPVAVDFPAEPPLGPTADPRTFLRDDDFPRWLRELPPLPPRPLRPARPEPVVIAVTEPAAIPEPMVEVAAPDSEPALPEVEPAPVMPVAAAAPPPTIATAPRRPAWEQALLALLGLAIVVAIVWAVIANGLIGGG